MTAEFYLDKKKRQAKAKTKVPLTVCIFVKSVEQIVLKKK